MIYDKPARAGNIAPPEGVANERRIVIQSALGPRLS